MPASAPVTSQQDALDVAVALAALARLQVVLQRAVAAAPPRRIASSAAAESGRAAQVGVDDHAGRVDHRAQRRLGIAGQPRRGLGDQARRTGDRAPSERRLARVFDGVAQGAHRLRVPVLRLEFGAGSQQGVNAR